MEAVVDDFEFAFCVACGCGCRLLFWFQRLCRIQGTCIVLLVFRGALRRLIAARFGLIQHFHLCTLRKKGLKLKPMCAAQNVTHCLFFFVFFSFFDEFTDAWTAFSSAFFACFLHRHFSLIHFLVSLFRQTCHLHFWSLVYKNTMNSSTDEFFINICGYQHAVTVALLNSLFRGLHFHICCVKILLREAWTVAIETLSWIEMRRLNERAALMRTVKQLGVKDPAAIRCAYRMVVETERRKNLIDKFINTVVAPKKIGEYNLGIQSFLRLYVYQTRVVKNWGKINLKEAESIASLGRAILGWQMMREVEPYLGFLLDRTISAHPGVSILKPKKSASQTFHPTWFVEYCFKLFGHEEAMAFLKGSQTSAAQHTCASTH